MNAMCNKVKGHVFLEFVKCWASSEYRVRRATKVVPDF
jgi:hypothetical protein